MGGLRAEGSKLLTSQNWIFPPDNMTAFVSLLTSQSINTNKNAMLFDNNMARFCHTQIIPYGSLWLLEPCYRRWQVKDLEAWSGQRHALAFIINIS